jgi:DNA repair protein RecO (recombination protein O)
MQWQDKGIILSQRSWNDSHAIVSIFTVNHGRHLGLIRPSKQPSAKAQLQPGNSVQALWQGRLSEHLGRWQLEAENIAWTQLLKMPKRLAALSSACGLLDKALPERHPYANLYEFFESFIKTLPTNDDWQRTYLKFELELLSTLGFGLTLDFCSVTKTTEKLVYVSPKTGHAVCEEVGRPYADRLLKLPPFLLNDQRPYETEDLRQAFHLTGYFLHRHIFENKELPPTRQQLAG